MAMTSCIVADDDQDIVDVFCDMLGMIGVNVLATANDGDQAVSMYKKYCPDIVFTDLNMPKYDGFYAIEKINDVNPNAKIVVVTGDSNAYQDLFLDSPNVRVIQKPFDVPIIKQVIEDCLAEDAESVQFNIKYQFKGEIRSYSCTVTYEQFKNLKELSIMEKCEIIKKDKRQFNKYTHEMDKAINMVIKNDTSHIRRLSEMVS